MTETESNYKDSNYPKNNPNDKDDVILDTGSVNFDTYAENGPNKKSDKDITFDSSDIKKASNKK